MDETNEKENLIDIDFIEPIDNSNIIVLPDTEEKRGNTDGSPIPVSDPNTLGTGNIISQIFKIIADIKQKTYWKLDDSEIKSLNNTCPKILPAVLKENAGLVSCVLSLLGIVLKRIKMERKEQIEHEDLYPKDSNDEIIKDASLTGARSG